MRLTWRKHLARRFRKSSSFYSLGLVISADAVTASALKSHAGQILWAEQQSFPIHDWARGLANWVKQHKMAATECHVVFSMHWYSLLQVDKPQVPLEEMSDALQWPVRELLPEKGELVLDYFDLPSQTTGGNKVNVVAMPKEQIGIVCDALFQADLKLESIGIAELATCNLTEDSDMGIITLFQEPGQEMCLNIVKNQKLYFSRRLKGYENLGSFSQQELQMGIVDTLSVQIQRSMDYFESQLRQAPVRKILLCVDSQSKQALAEQIQRMTNLQVAIFTPDVTLAPGLEQGTAGYLALGAALSPLHLASEQQGQVA